MAEREKDTKVEALLGQLLEGLSPEEVMGKLLQELQKGIMERMLEGELTAHLGYEKHAPEGRNRRNSRNGHSRKRVKTGTSDVELEVPRDREGSFEPVLVPKGQRRLPGFDEKVLALYARGMTTREIQGHPEEVYGVEVSTSPISTVTDAALDEVKACQARPLEAVYPIVFLDVIHVKGALGPRLDPGRVPGSGLDPGRREGAPWAVGRRGRGRQVLTKHPHGAEEHRGAGHPHRRR